MGTIEAIWCKLSRGGAMEPRQTAVLVKSQGLDGSANQGGARQVTVISREAWAAALNDLGTEVPPIARRANLMVSGLDLRESVGKTLRLGGCRLRIHGETWPCAQMEAAQPGLLEALKPDWRGGVFGEVLEGGEIARGVSASWEDDDHRAD